MIQSSRLESTTDGILRISSATSDGKFADFDTGVDSDGNFLTISIMTIMHMDNILVRFGISGLTPISSSSGIVLSMRPANERQRYIVTLSLIGWEHRQNDPCIL